MYPVCNPMCPACNPMCPGVAGLLGHGLLGGGPEGQAAVHPDIRLLGALAAARRRRDHDQVPAQAV
eukprot:scaffold85692_cov18-Phaeocystis_antarctica.AAC.1